jgi:hypothetical protein
VPHEGTSAPRRVRYLKVLGRVTFRVTSRWQNPKTDASDGDWTKATANAKSLSRRELHATGPFQLGFRADVLKTPTLSASSPPSRPASPQIPNDFGSLRLEKDGGEDGGRHFE